MKIEINIPQLDGLSDSINNLANAIAGSSEIKISAPVTTVETVSEAPKADTTPEAEKETPATKEKRELSEKIIALGGTPPEKGAVAKYRETLKELENAKKPQAADPDEQLDEEEKHRSSDNSGSESEETETQGQPVVTLENARSFAVVFMSLGDPDEQREKVKGYLADAGAKSITKATQEQRETLVRKLEVVTGLTLAEAVKKHAES